MTGDVKERVVGEEQLARSIARTEADGHQINDASKSREVLAPGILDMDIPVPLLALFNLLSS